MALRYAGARRSPASLGGKPESSLAPCHRLRLHCQPLKYFFLQPLVTQVAAGRYGYDFNCSSKRSWATYSSLLGFAGSAAHPRSASAGLYRFAIVHLGDWIGGVRGLVADGFSVSLMLETIENGRDPNDRIPIACRRGNSEAPFRHAVRIQERSAQASPPRQSESPRNLNEPHLP